MRHPFLRTLAGSAATPTDPNFENVTLLLHGDGTNGGQNNTFVDGSTNNFTITRNGNTTQGTFSPYGDNWSNYFDGTDDYLSIADNANLRAGSGTFTIEAWIYRNATGAAHTIYAKGGASTGIVFQVTSTDVLRFTHTTTNIDSTGTIGLATWTHVAVVREGTGTNETKLYINGTQDGAGTVSTDFTQTEEVRIGTNRGATEDFNGYISNLRFVKGTAVYTGTFTVPTSPLTAISNTQLLTCKSNRFRDESANAFTVTRNNNASVQRFSPFSPTAAYAAGTIGGSGYFDGTGDYLQLTGGDEFNLTGDFTIEAWVYRTGTGAQRVVGKWNFSGSLAWVMEISATAVGIGVGNNGSFSNSYSFSATVNPFCWNHVALTRSGSTIRGFLNGADLGSQTSSANCTANNTVPVQIGQTENTNYVNGYVCDVRVLKGTAQYTGAYTVPTAPLTAITNTSLLLNFQNAAILDNAMMAVPETFGNAQISTSVKKYGTGSLAFDGTGDYIHCYYPSADISAFGTGDFTVEFWLYTNAANTTYQVIDCRPPSTNGAYLAFYLETGTPQVYFSSANKITGGAKIPGTTWTHVAICRSGSSMRLFINGTQSGSTLTDSTNFIGLTNRPAIGGFGGFNNDPLNGYIDDLRITKGVARYTANFTAPTAAFPDL